MFVPIILILVVIGVFATVAASLPKQDQSKSSRFFSLNLMANKLLLLAKRFAISILLVIGLATSLFILIYTHFDDDYISHKRFIFFSIGALISVTVTLFCEDFFNKLKTSVITLLAVLLWGLYSFFLPDDDIQVGKFIEIFVIGESAFVAIFFVSFMKKGQARAFWNFTSYTLLQFVLATLFGAIIFGGLGLALLAIKTLFEIDFSEETFAYLAITCFVLFSPLYFLANIPQKEKHSDVMFYSKIQKTFSLSILTPLLVVYAVILYAYLLKIVFTWELPNGWVSYLVSALAFGGLFVMFLLYPIREQENNRIVNFIYRWLGLLMLPLLVLMSIGVFRRIGDYGITINRMYVLLLNLWFYGIYCYLFLSKTVNISRIVISFVVVALLTSVSIWGVSAFTQNTLTHNVEKILDKPQSFAEAKDVITKLSQDEKNELERSLKYLYNYFGEKSVQPFFTDMVPNDSWLLIDKLDLDVDVN